MLLRFVTNLNWKSLFALLFQSFSAVAFLDMAARGETTSLRHNSLIPFWGRKKVNYKSCGLPHRTVDDKNHELWQSTRRYPIHHDGSTSSDQGKERFHREKTSAINSGQLQGWPCGWFRFFQNPPKGTFRRLLCNFVRWIRQASFLGSTNFVDQHPRIALVQQSPTKMDEGKFHNLQNWLHSFTNHFSKKTLLSPYQDQQHEDDFSLPLLPQVSHS